MKIQNALLVAAAVVCGMIFVNSDVSAKTAKECIAEWRADKAGMQARGTTQKAYVAQCKGGAELTAAAPAANPPETAPAAPARTTASGGKTAKDCIAEWRADKAGMQARGTTQKAYVAQCKGGSAPAGSVPETRPTAEAPAQAPAAPATQANGPSSQKTAKECVAEWRADKAGMQARGITQKAYVAECRIGGAVPSAGTPEPRPTAAPARAPTETQAAPPPAPRRPTPAAAPAQQPSAPRSTATLEANQFADDVSAKASCPTDTVVWVNLPSKIYHFAGTKNYGTTSRGVYMCEKLAIAGENRASKTETHP
jgi:hypothetical protein